jgi:adenylate cyclase
MAVESGARLAKWTYSRLDRVGGISNALGAVVVFLFIFFLAPRTLSHKDWEHALLGNAIAFGVFTPAGLLIGRTWTARVFAPIMDWLREERPATDDERKLLLSYPLRFALIAGVIWVAAAVFFTGVNLALGVQTVAPVGVTIILGGVTATAVEFLLVERSLREATARGLAGAAPPGGRTPGVGLRLIMAWLLATAVPLLGVVAFSIAELTSPKLDAHQVVVASLFLVGVALVIGLLAIRVAARSVSDPVREVSRAFERVEGGDFDASVPVTDANEVGVLQAGFNRMVAGLAEREHMRDLFGRHVGDEVARAALDGEVRLGGEVREVGVLFLDIVGSTTLAAERPPEEVVSLLNAFFAIVVEVTEAHHGLVNKFEGDAALCVFGAPTTCDDPAGDALCAGRELRDRLRAALPDVDFGIGVSFGRAVAGNVGAERRYEYTVIGDPVNEGARLCELAKSRPERLLASEATVESAQSEEARRWAFGEAVTLRGRPEATRLATVPA